MSDCGCFYDVHTATWTQLCNWHRWPQWSGWSHDVQQDMIRQRVTTPIEWTWLHGGAACP